MLTVILVALVVAAIVCGIIAYGNRSEGFCIVAVLCAVFAVVLGGICVGMWCDVATEYAIDQKIAMYEEENTQIETEIDLIVKEYMAHEQKTFKEVSPDRGEDSMVLVSLFPELKSDELVTQQISLHNSNAKQIKILKAEKIDLAKTKWLLYFGR